MTQSLDLQLPVPHRSWEPDLSVSVASDVDTDDGIDWNVTIGSPDSKPTHVSLDLTGAGRLIEAT